MAQSRVVFLALDIGRTKIEVCKFSAAYELVSSANVSTAGFPIGTPGFLSPIKKIIKDNLVSKIAKIGISFNGVVKDGKVLYSPLLGGMTQYPLADDFGKEFGLPVALENNINAMTVAESKFGKGQKVHSFVLLNIGAEIHLAYVHQGRLIEGFTNNIGEISQRLINITEMKNRVFRSEEVISGRGITNIYREICEKIMGPEEIFSLAGKEVAATQATEIFNKYFSQLLSEISYFYNPELVILSGPLAKKAHLFLPESLKIYEKITFDISRFRDLVVSDLEHAACLGAII